MSLNCEVQVRFYPPPPELRQYFLTFYIAEWVVPAEGRVTDYLLPEWANLRFHSGSIPTATTLSGMELSGTSFAVNGPTSQAIRFSIGTSRMWGVGLLPLGWAKYVQAPASDFADGVYDGDIEPVFSVFAPLSHTLFADLPDEQAELDKLTSHFLNTPGAPPPDAHRIAAIHTALLNPEVSSVLELVDLVGISQRTIERICLRTFGFTPKLMLRRQRFMRSLTHFMLDPSLRWIGSIDSQYHDQSQFVRDFHQFIGMTPREYSLMDKPLVAAVMRARMQAFGKPAQMLDSPVGKPSSD